MLKNDIIFLIRQALVHDYCATEILYYFLSILMTPNVKTQNNKVVGLIERTPYKKDIIMLLNFYIF
jgi:hypothetical protein